MENLPGWIGMIAVILTIAAVLGAAVAVYKTNLQGTSLREAERTIDRLRGEIGDYQRRERELENDLKLANHTIETCVGRVTILEDLISKRQDDDEIRAEIAAVRKVVDENVITQLTAILQSIQNIQGGKA